MVSAHKTLNLSAFLPLFFGFWWTLQTLIYDVAKKWRSSGISGEALEATLKYNGLYLACALYTTGQEECADQGSIEGYFIACKILMGINLTCLGFAILTYFVGSEHSIAFFKDYNAEQKKAKISLISAGLCAASCFLTLVVIILFTNGTDDLNIGIAPAQAETADLGGSYGEWGTDEALDYLKWGAGSLLVYIVLQVWANYNTAKYGTDLDDEEYETMYAQSRIEPQEYQQSMYGQFSDRDYL